MEKLGDIKLKKSAGDALMAFSEKISVQFVLSQGKPPKIHNKHVYAFDIVYKYIYLTFFFYSIWYLAQS